MRALKTHGPKRSSKSVEVIGLRRDNSKDFSDQVLGKKIPALFSLVLQFSGLTLKMQNIVL